MSGETDTVCRLDRLLAALAAVSRTQAQALIRQGCVQVNDAVCRQAACHPPLGSLIALHGTPLDARMTRHIMLHKPVGVLTAARDSRQPTVFDLLPPPYAALRCMPVGRLDKDTSGLLLLTTDGQLSHRLLAPGRHVWKRYEVTVDGALDEHVRDAFARGVQLADFTALPARLDVTDPDGARKSAIVWVREGKYHQVRRMFAACGRTVLTLKRVGFGALDLERALEPGAYRELTQGELRALWRDADGESHA